MLTVFVIMIVAVDYDTDFSLRTYVTYNEASNDALIPIQLLLDVWVTVFNTERCPS